MFRKIVFANEGSPAGDRALLYLEHLGRREGSEVVVVHAFQVPHNYASTEAFDELHSAYEKAAWMIVDDAVQELERAEVLVRGIVREGSAAQVILEVAEEENASLIVLGTRGPSNTAELLLGSVSTEVLRFARCPVMSVP
ncbi:MAG: universal stress protein [Anaerolineae bacterium]